MAIHPFRFFSRSDRKVPNEINGSARLLIDAEPGSHAKDDVTEVSFTLDRSRKGLRITWIDDKFIGGAASTKVAIGERGTFEATFAAGTSANIAGHVFGDKVVVERYGMGTGADDTVAGPAYGQSETVELK